MNDIAANGAFSAEQKALIDAANAEREAVESGAAPAPAPEPAPAAEQTALILGKFKSQDDLAAAYKELEKKLGAKPADEPAPNAEAPAAEADSLTIKKADEAAEPAAEPAEAAPEAETINGKVVTDEHRTAWTAHLEGFAKDGKLTDDAYKFAATEFGVTDKSIIDAYARGQIAEQQLAANAQIDDIVSVVGGKAEYAKVADWASKNLSEAELAEFNATVESGTAKEAKQAIQLLKFRADSAEPAPPANPLSGDTSMADADADTFADMKEQIAAVNKLDDNGRRLYDYDKAYRAKVEQKVERTAAARSKR